MKEGEPGLEVVRLTASDFVHSMIHISARWYGGKFTFNPNEVRLHKAMKAAYDVLDEQAEEARLNLRFTIAPNAMHGDSTVVSEALSELLGLQAVDLIGGRYDRQQYRAASSLGEVIEATMPYPPLLEFDLLTTFVDTYERDQVSHFPLSSSGH